MKYSINPAVFSSSFSFPSNIVDENLSVATETEIKVILYFFRHFADGIVITDCSNALKISEKDVAAALSFWSKIGVISSQNNQNGTATEITAKAVVKNEKPNRMDVAKRGNEDKNFAMILREAQMKFGRSLKTNESATLLYIYEDLGLDLSVCLYLLQYAVNEGKKNIRFIEKTAVSWVNSGVKTISDAEKIVIKEMNTDLAWKRCEKAFGIEHRKPSAKEAEYCLKWFDEWGLADDVLTLAYDVCVDAKSKFIFSYCAKVIENWYGSGLKTRSDIEKSLAKNVGAKPEDNNYAGYDLDLYKKMFGIED